MLKRLALFTFAGIAALMSCSVLRAAQTVPPTQSAGETDADKWKTEKWNTPSPPGSYWEKMKSAPGPQRDLSGIWDAGGVQQGVQANGAYEYPDDPEHLGHDVPYTPLGKEARQKNKPGTGMGQFPVAEVNDRVNSDTLELTVTIDDPKFYTQPWKGLDRYVLHRLPDGYDISEFICSATETAEYNRLVGKPVDPAAAASTNK